MSIRTKIVAAISAIVVIVAGAVLIAVKPWAGGSDEATITWWVPDWDEAVATELVAEFEAENPDYDVEIVLTTWDTMADKIRVALDAGTAPEVITELTSRVARYARADQLTDVTSWYDSSMPTEDFLTSALEAVTVNGATYAVPFRHDSSVLLYNREQLAAAGYDEAPQSWDEVVAMSADLTSEAGYAFGWPLGNDNNAVVRWLEQYLSNGGDLTPAADGSLTIDETAAAAGLTSIAESIQEGWASQSSLELDNTALRDLMANGKVAMYVGGAYDIAPLQEAGIDVGTAPYPGVGGAGTTTADGFSLLVPADIENTDGAQALVQFLAQPHNEAALTATFPARVSAMEDERFSDPLQQPAIDQLMEYSVPLPNHPAWSDMTPAIFAAVQSVVLGDQTAADGAASIVAEAERLLGPIE